MAVDDTILASACWSLASRLTKDAFQNSEKDLCNWIGPTVIQPEEGQRFVSLPSELYLGSSGISLALAELHRLRPNENYLEVAKASLRRSIQNATVADDPKRCLSFYGGDLGLAYTSMRLMEIVGDDPIDLVCDKFLERAVNDVSNSHHLDITGGAAGALQFFVLMHHKKGKSEYLQVSHELARELCIKARWENNYCYWPSVEATGLTFESSLGGYAHGVSGIATALYDYFDVTQDSSALRTARGALAYEQTLFDLERRNWRDVRSSTNYNYPVAWCHGAAGIAIAFSRASSIDKENDRDYLKAVEIALSTTIDRISELKDNPASDLSLCHGLAGLVDVLLICGQLLRSPRYIELGREAGMHLAEKALSSKEIFSGLPTGLQHPSLMLGTAGTLHALIRTLDPAGTPSILYVGKFPGENSDPVCGK